MWIFIVLVILAIGIKFLYDRNSMLENIDSNGGMLLKYHTLAQYILAMPDSKILEVEKGSISFISNDVGGCTYFTITSAFNVVMVEWEFRGPLMVNFKQTWNFKEDRVTQKEMIAQMEKDVTKKLEYLLTSMDKSDTDDKSIDLESEEKGSTSQPIKEPVDDPEKSVAVEQAKVNLLNVTVEAFTKSSEIIQAQIFLIFYQNQHNNPFIDSLRQKFNILDVYGSYQNGFNVAKEHMPMIKNYPDDIVGIFRSVNHLGEIFRLVAIVKYFTGDKQGFENAFKKSIESWELFGSQPTHYIYNLYKTQADLLIVEGRYFEAVSLLEDNLSVLINTKRETLNWLIYQYAKSLLQVSQHVKTVKFSLLEISRLVDEMEKLVLSAKSIKQKGWSGFKLIAETVVAFIREGKSPLESWLSLKDANLGELRMFHFIYCWMCLVDNKLIKDKEANPETYFVYVIAEILALTPTLNLNTEILFHHYIKRFEEYKKELIYIRQNSKNGIQIYPSTFYSNILQHPFGGVSQQEVIEENSFWEQYQLADMFTHEINYLQDYMDTLKEFNEYASL